MGKQKPQSKPEATSTVEEEIKDRVQSENVEPEKVENPPETERSSVPTEQELSDARSKLAEAMFNANVPAVKLEQYDPATHLVVNRKLFNKMITTLCLNKGLFLYTGSGLTTQLGEMLGLKKNEPGFYEKARTLMHEIMVEHQRG